MKHLFVFFIFFCSFIVKAQGQTTFEETLQKLENYKAQFPREKVYLHLDKPFYSIGEPIWFKAYLTVGALNYLSSVSKILYVELINSSDEVTISARLPVVNGITYGDITLPDTLSEGNYRIRAYTNWMRNFDERYFFDRNIQIGDALKNPLLTQSSFSILNDGDKKTMRSNLVFRDLDENPINNARIEYAVLSDKKSIHQGREMTNENGEVALSFKEPKGGLSNTAYIEAKIETSNKKVSKQFPIRNTDQLVSIQFFPQNGTSLIGGILNTVAFKVCNNDGRGLDAKGVILDSKNEQISEFETDLGGIGSFVFRPEANQSYKAAIDLSDGSTQEVNLPQVVSEGYLINANTWSSNQIFIQISTPEPVKDDAVNLILQSNGEVFYAAKVKIAKPETTISIPKANLPLGVVEARLLRDSMQDLGSRKIYITNENRILPLEVTSDKQQYGARDLVKFQLKAGAPQDSSRIATLSVSVTDMEKVPVDTLTATTIDSYLTLNSATSNYIQSPSHYLKSSEFKVKSQLDDLVLTFGKDSVWQKIRNTEPLKPKYPPEQALQVSGKITRFNGKPVPFATVMLFASGSGSIIDTVADENGRFNFDRLLFYEDTKFIVQARDEKGKKNVEIVLDEVPRQEVSKNKNESDITLSMNKSMDVYLKNSQKRFEELIKSGQMDNSIILEDVEITVEKKNPAKNSSNLNGPGNADQVLGEDDLKNCSDLTICLQGRLMGVMFKNGIPYSTRSMDIPMQVIVDGMYMEGEALSMIPAMDVEAVEVLRRPGSLGIYGSMAAGGAILITTKQGDASYRKPMYTPGIMTYSPQGLSEVEEFQSPDYSTTAASEALDLRSTIYWNPTLVSDENGDATFNFYTADEPGRYRIVVEGIDVYGRIARSETFIEVVKE